MARPRKIGLDYFPFDVDFFNDEKIEAISGEFGIKGEIVAIKLLAAIYRNGYFIEWSEMLQMKMLKTLPSISKELLTEIVQRLVRWNFFDEGLFNSDNVLTSRGIQRRYFEAMKRNSLSDSLPFLLVSVTETDVSTTKTRVSVTETPQSKGKESKVNISFLEKKKQKSASVDFYEEEKNNQPLSDQKETSPQVAPAPPPDSEESKKTKKRFVPPTPEEVQNYCNERGNGISGTEFCDFYTSKGWKVGREPMKDWKAAVRTWEAKRKNNTQTNQTITIDENGNRITNTGNSNTNTSTPYVFGRQTAEDLRANLSGW